MQLLSKSSFSMGVFARNQQKKSCDYRMLHLVINVSQCPNCSHVTAKIMQQLAEVTLNHHLMNSLISREMVLLQKEREVIIGRTKAGEVDAPEDGWDILLSLPNAEPVTARNIKIIRDK